MFSRGVIPNIFRGTKVNPLNNKDHIPLFINFIILILLIFHNFDFVQLKEEKTNLLHNLYYDFQASYDYIINDYIIITIYIYIYICIYFFFHVYKIYKYTYMNIEAEGA